MIWLTAPQGQSSTAWDSSRPAGCHSPLPPLVSPCAHWRCPGDCCPRRTGWPRCCGHSPTTPPPVQGWEASCSYWDRPICPASKRRPAAGSPGARNWGRRGNIVNYYCQLQLYNYVYIWMYVYIQTDLKNWGEWICMYIYVPAHILYIRICICMYLCVCINIIYIYIYVISVYLIRIYACVYIKVYIHFKLI